MLQGGDMAQLDRVYCVVVTRLRCVDVRQHAGVAAAPAGTGSADVPTTGLCAVRVDELGGWSDGFPTHPDVGRVCGLPGGLPARLGERPIPWHCAGSWATS